MRTLILVDGSRPSQHGLEALLSETPPEEMVLLFVSPSARRADLEHGRRVLELAKRTCASLAPESAVQACLEVGDLAECTCAVAKKHGVERIACSSHDASSFPYLEETSAATRLICDEVPGYEVEVLPGEDVTENELGVGTV